MKAAAWWVGGFGAVAAAVVVAGAGCSSSSGSSDGGGEDGPQYYTSPEASDGEGGAVDAGPDEPVCVVPSSATIAETLPQGGMATCTPGVPNGQCTATEFRLLCTAPDPYDVPVPPTALGCQLEAPSTSTRFTYCCECAQGAGGGGDP